MSMNWLTTKQENNLALSSIKFDFTLVKFEAPREYNGLGAALGQRRKIDAEDGGIHRTARKLGALFEQIIPSTPKLITAYGQRVSEIMTTPGVNPKGDEKDGPFESFVGADATVLWAAATSGTPAIAMYMLATLLADWFDHKAAISIWVELIADRKRDIQDEFNNNSLILESSVVAARQEISRQELALWDTSARAWMQSADQLKTKERSQFLLISKNVALHKPQGMEELLHGRSQEILDCCIPSAVIAWHLFPDLLVLGGEVSNVSFDDGLIPKSATCIIGVASLAGTGPQSSGNWSLSLSHYRYYGDPVEVNSEDESRVTFEQFLVINLGAVLGNWSIQREDITAAMHWFLDLGRALNLKSLRDEVRASVRGFEWLACLVEGAQHLIHNGGREDKTYLQLIELGMRRGTKLLTNRSRDLPPFLGLRNARVYRSLQAASDLEGGIAFMQETAKSMGLTNDAAIIVISHPYYANSLRWFEFASVQKICHESQRQTMNGCSTIIQSYCRCLMAECERFGDPISAEVKLFISQETSRYGLEIVQGRDLLLSDDQERPFQPCLAVLRMDPGLRNFFEDKKPALNP